MQCPVCRAENGDEASCRRCKADLSLCQNVRKQQLAMLGRVADAIATHASETAVTIAAEAVRVKADAESFRWSAIASLLARDFPAAWKHYHQWKTLTSR